MQLEEMGFCDREKNLGALRRHRNQVCNTVIEDIFNELLAAAGNNMGSA